MAQFPAARPGLIVPIFNAYEDVIDCVASLAATLDTDTPVFLVDDCSTDPRIAATLRDAAGTFGRHFGYFRKPFNSGFVGSINLGFECAGRRDVVIINSDTVYPPGWLERLTAAAYSRSTVATATPLTNHGSLLSVPFRDTSVNYIAGDFTVDEADARIAAASHKLRPLIPTAIGHCTYFRRRALDIVGFLDEAFAPGYGEEVDFSQRAISLGFSHVAADDLFIFHKGAMSFSAEGQEKRQRIKDAHEALINQRYPWYRNWVAEVSLDRHSPLARALARASAALLGYTIAIDASYVAPTTTGTAVVSLELIRAIGLLAARGHHLTLLVSSQWPAAMRQEMAQYVDEVRTVAEFHALKGPQFDLIFRPCQVLNADDLLRLRTLARRFIILQLDLIAYANPAYQRSYAEWQRYRYLTELSVAFADGVAFNSGDVEDDARARGLELPVGRTCIAHNGVDHHYHQGLPQPPATRVPLPPRGYLFVLGTNFKHKNRAQAIRIFAELLRQQQWDGYLVFAGPPVSHGGSAAEEEAVRKAHPEIADRFMDLGPVSEAEKRWLLENAALVLYPSTAEGFGLIPFEAAAAGTAALVSPVASLPEVLGDQVRYLPSDPAEAAPLAWELMTDPAAAQCQLDAVLARSRLFQWDDVAARLWQFCLDILELPPRSILIDEQVDLARRLTLPGAADGQTAAKNWWQRLRLAVHILRTEGMGPLTTEIKQYINWIIRT